MVSTECTLLSYHYTVKKIIIQIVVSWGLSVLGWSTHFLTNAHWNMALKKYFLSGKCPLQHRTF